MTTAAPPGEMEEQMIGAACHAAREVLELPVDADPATVHQSIHQFLCHQNTRTGLFRKRPPLPLGEDCPVAMGALWGAAICEEFGWSWVIAKRGDWAGLGIA